MGYFETFYSGSGCISGAGIEKKIPLYLIKFKQLLKYLSTHLTTAGSKNFLNVMLISCHAALLFCSYFLTWHISHKELAVVGFYFETKPWCIALYIQGMAEWLRRWISEWPKFDSWWTHLCHVVKLVEYQGQQYCYLEWPGSIPTRGNMKFSLVKPNNKVRLVFGVSRFKPESKFCHFVKFKKRDNKWKFKLMQVFQKKASDCQKPCGQVGRALGTTLLLSWVPGFDPIRDDMIFSKDLKGQLMA